MLNWYFLDKAAYTAAVTANKVTDEMMIFVSDTKEIYRGTLPFTESAVIFTGDKPVTAAVGKIYFEHSTMAGWVYNGTNWTQVIKGVATTVTADGTDPVTGAAVASYVADAVAGAQANITALEQTVSANKTAAEQAVATEKADREAADETLQDNIDTVAGDVTELAGTVEANKTAAADATAAVDAKAVKNAEDIAVLQVALEDYATGKELEDAVADLQGKLDTTNGNVAANTSAIATLNGDVNTNGSILNTVNNALTNIIGEDVEGSIDTLKELVTWANDHAGDALELSNNVSANSAAITAINNLLGTALPEGTSATTVIAYIAEVADALAQEITDRANGDSALDSKITELNGTVSTLQQTVANNKAAIEKSLEDAVAALEAADETLQDNIDAVAGDVTELAGTVEANKTAAEEAIAAVDAKAVKNAEDIAAVNTALGNYALTSALDSLRETLQASIDGKMAKVATGNTGKVLVAAADGNAAVSTMVVGGSTFGTNQTGTLATEAGAKAYTDGYAVAKTSVVTTIDAENASDIEVPSESAVVSALSWKTSI